MKTIQSLINERRNNFDVIRLIAAIFVVFSHSFALSMGYIDGHHPDPLRTITEEISFGKLAVIIFFIISGYLITQSYDKSRNPIHFVKCRILRIIPGLIFVTVLSVLLLGPIVSTLKIEEYFTSKATWLYLKNIAIINMVNNLPGVFENNSYPDAVNSSLWTLNYEIKCYLVVLVLGMTRLLKKSVIMLLFALTSIVYVLGYGGDNIEYLFYFSAGMVFYVFREKILLNKTAAAVTAVIAIICLLFYAVYLMPLLIICITYTIMHLAYNTRVKINISKKIGDLSYGIYIFAFPIQQSITNLYGGYMKWWMNFLLSLPIVIFMAAVSWFLIEKNALKLKNVTLYNSIKKLQNNKKAVENYTIGEENRL